MAKLFLKADNAKDQNDKSKNVKFYFDENDRLVIKVEEQRIVLSDEDTTDLQAFVAQDKWRYKR